MVGIVSENKRYHTAKRSLNPLSGSVNSNIGQDNSGNLIYSPLQARHEVAFKVHLPAHSLLNSAKQLVSHGHPHAPLDQF
jgi:hypothetical protein